MTDRKTTSTRLTKDIRDRILTDVLRHRFSEAVEALIADRAAFAEEVYNDCFKKAQREKMEALPEGWLSEEPDIAVQFRDAGKGYENLHFDGRVYGPLSAARKPRKNDAFGPKRPHKRFPSKFRSGCVKVYDGDHRLAKKHASLADREGELRKELDAAERQTEAALNSVTTINRLIETWPEIEPFAREYADKPNKVPAIPTNQLNEILGLPVSEAA